MHLYKINTRIMCPTVEIKFDPETGEILCDINSIERQNIVLQIEKKSSLIWLVKLVLNINWSSIFITLARKILIAI